jgi:heat shock protein HtpX
MTVTACLAGAIGMLAQFGFLFGGRDRERGPGPVAGLLIMLLAPLAAAVVQMAISRAREYEADRGAAAITGHPAGLAQALTRLEQGRGLFLNPAAENHPATAHMFIINPLSGARLDGLFSTHPRTENRVAALMELAQQMGRRGGWSDSGAAPISAPLAAAAGEPGGPWSAGAARPGGKLRRNPWG